MFGNLHHYQCFVFGFLILGSQKAWVSFWFCICQKIKYEMICRCFLSPLLSQISTTHFQCNRHFFACRYPTVMLSIPLCLSPLTGGDRPARIPGNTRRKGSEGSRGDARQTRIPRSKRNKRKHRVSRSVFSL